MLIKKHNIDVFGVLEKKANQAKLNQIIGNKISGWRQVSGRKDFGTMGSDES